MGIVQMPELEKRYGRALVYLLTGGLEHGIENGGGVLSGFTMRGGHGDVLLIIRARFEHGAMVAFIGGPHAAHVLKTAEKKIRSGELRWRVDRYDNGG